MRLPLLLALLTAAAPVLAQSPPAVGEWESLNPGAGGQVQEIALDPLVPDRAYVLSDVEGMYRTDDGGASYQFVPNGLLSIDILGIAIDPVDTDRVYIGTDLGLQYSDDAGETWIEHPDVIRASNPTLLTASPSSAVNARLHVSPLVVDPTNPDRVAAGLGNKRFSTVTTATVFWSDDRGQTFQPARFGGLGGGGENILQLAAGGGLLLAAAETAGIWTSPDFGQTWTQLPTPDGAGPLAEGVAVTPDGGTLYAAYRRPNTVGNRIYAARITDGVPGPWTLILGENYPDASTTDVVNPQFTDADWRALAVDPRSTADRHALLTAEDHWRTGLFEVTVDWTSGAPEARWENVFYYPDRETAPFDIGYESNYPRPLSFQYTPLAWGGRGIWTTGDQTLFKAVDTSAPDWTETWEALYTSDPVQTFEGGLQTYRDRGWVSTVDFDADQHLNAVCSAKGDHGVSMSWDSGFSWEVDSSPWRARSNACRFIETPTALYVLAHLTDGYGGSSDGGEIWAARLDRETPGPADWLFLAGGDGTTYGSPNGLPDHRIDYIEQNPFAPAQVLLSVRDEPRGTGSPGGVYVIDDIDALYAAREARTPPPPLYRLGGPGAPSAPTEKDNTVRFDPNTPGVLYVADRNAMLRGTRTRAGWLWTPVCESDQQMKMNVWNRGGQTMLACRRVRLGRQWVQISADGGQTWREAFDLDRLKQVGDTPFDEDPAGLEIWNLAGIGERLFVNVQQNGGGKIGLGIFEATVEADGSATRLQDVTGPVRQPRAIRMRADHENGRRWLFLASWGAGTWRRYLGPVDADGLGALPWREPFAAPDGTDADPLPPSQWTSSTTGADGSYARVAGGRFECQDATWTSGAVDVSSLSDVTLAFTLDGDAQVSLVLDGDAQAVTNAADAAGRFRASVETAGVDRAEIVVTCPPGSGLAFDNVALSAGRVSAVGAAADATADQGQPTTALGATPDLLVRQSSQARYAYVRFPLDGLGGSRVERAVLSLTQLNDTEVRITAYPTDATWDEGALTFDTRPADAGAAVASADTPGREGGMLVLDVTDAVRAAMGGTLSLRLEGERSAALFSSREGSAGPTLELALLDVATDAADGPGVVGGLRVGPAVPNPSRAVAVVRYELDAPAEVRLALYDARGRQLQVLSQGQRTAGDHRVQIDVSTLPAGVYVYRLEAGEAVASGTAVVIR